MWKILTKYFTTLSGVTYSYKYIIRTIPSPVFFLYIQALSMVAGSLCIYVRCGLLISNTIRYIFNISKHFAVVDQIANTNKEMPIDWETERALSSYVIIVMVYLVVLVRTPFRNGPLSWKEEEEEEEINLCKCDTRVAVRQKYNMYMKCIDQVLTGNHCLSRDDGTLTYTYVYI